MSEATTPDKDQRTGGRARRVFTRVLLLGVAPLLAIAAGLYFYYTGGRYVSTENAYVRADIIAISTDINGRVAAVNVTNNQRVMRGTELFRIDPEPFQLLVGEAEAQMQLARVSIDAMRADYREAVVSIKPARQQVRYLQRRLDRQAKLIKRGLVSAAKHDEASHELKVAKQQVTTLNQRARRALADLGGDVEMAYEAHPAYAAAQFRLNLARSRERQTVVLAPADGIVSNMQLQAGEFVKQGQPIFSLVNDSEVWVEANLKETQLTHLSIGQRATLSVDAYPDIEWHAVVSDIAPATGAEFSLLPPQNATGNWVKVVQRVPVRLKIDLRGDGPQLRAGMTVTAKIDTGHQRKLPAPFSSEPIDKLKNTPIKSAPQPPVPMTRETAGRGAALQRASVQSSASGTIVGSDSASRAVSFDANAVNGSDWLQQQDAVQYTIQVGRSDNREFLLKFAKTLPPGQASVLYQYSESYAGKQPYGLITGVYANVPQARSAMAGLPKAARRFGPWVRRIGALQRETFGVAKRAKSGQ